MDLLQHHWSISLPSLPSLPSINIGLPSIDIARPADRRPDGRAPAASRPSSRSRATRSPSRSSTTRSRPSSACSPASLPTDAVQPQNLEVKVGSGCRTRSTRRSTWASAARSSCRLADARFDDHLRHQQVLPTATTSSTSLTASTSATTHRQWRRPAECASTPSWWPLPNFNAFIIRGGVEGGIKLTGTLDIYDENKDNKYRASRLIAAVSEDPSWSPRSLRGSACVAAYVVLSSDLRLGSGCGNGRSWTSRSSPGSTTRLEAHPRHDGWLHPQPQRRLRRRASTAGVDHQHLRRSQAPRHRRRQRGYTLSGSDGVNISATLTNGQTYTRTFVGVSKVKSLQQANSDTFDASALDRPVLFIAGSGTGTTLIGGSADDVLIGSDSGTATLRGNGGNDHHHRPRRHHLDDRRQRRRHHRDARQLGPGHHTSSANIVDFSRQTAAVTVDDTELKALRGAAPSSGRPPPPSTRCAAARAATSSTCRATPPTCWSASPAPTPAGSSGASGMTQ